jgi:hypothetical protein
MSTLIKIERDERQKWIGLARVEPQPGNSDLGGAATGAFVGVIAFAASVDDYDRMITAALNEEGFNVLEIEDIQTFAERLQGDSLAPDVLDLAESVDETNPIAIGTFHCFPAMSDESKENGAEGHPH